MKPWPTYRDCVGACLMLAIFLAWHWRADFVEIVRAAKQRHAELSLDCGRDQ